MYEKTRSRMQHRRILAATTVSAAKVPEERAEISEEDMDHAITKVKMEVPDQTQAADEQQASSTPEKPVESSQDEIPEEANALNSHENEQQHTSEAPKPAEPRPPASLPQNTIKAPPPLLPLKVTSEEEPEEIAEAIVPSEKASKSSKESDPAASPAKNRCCCCCCPNQPRPTPEECRKPMLTLPAGSSIRPLKAAQTFADSRRDADNARSKTADLVTIGSRSSWERSYPGRNQGPRKHPPRIEVAFPYQAPFSEVVDGSISQYLSGRAGIGSDGRGYSMMSS